MGVFLRNKKFQADKDGATTLPVTIPPDTIVGDLMLLMAIGPPGQPDDPWSVDLDATPASVGGDVDPSDSPMLIHQALWWKIVEQSDLDAGQAVFTAPASNTVAAAAIHVYYGHDPDDPVPVSTGSPFCETGTNPCAGEHGNRTNPDCPCDTLELDDITVPANGMLAVAYAFSHKQAWPFAPPEGFAVIDFPLTKRTGGGADIAQCIATKTVYAGTLSGPTFVPADVGWDNAGARVVLIRPAIEPPGLSEPPKLFIGDPNEGAEPVSAAVDLTGLLTGSSSGFMPVDDPTSPNFGDPQQAIASLTELGWDHAEYGGRTRGPRDMAIPLIVEASDFDGARTLDRVLQQYVDRPGILVLQPPGLDPTYYDFLGGDATSLLDGTRGGGIGALQGAHGLVLLELKRQAKTRRPRLSSYLSGQLSNQFNECWVVLDNPGTAESPTRWVITPPANGSAELVRVWVARVSHGNITERTKNERGFGAWDAERVDAVIGDDATIVSSAHASNGEEVTTTFDVPPFTWVDISRFEATPEDPTSLVGRFRTLLVARQEEGQKVRYRRLFGTAAGQEPTFSDLPYREIDSTQMDQTKYRLVDVGEMEFDQFGNALVQQIQVRAVDADSDGLVVGVDQVKNLPADEQLVTVAERSFLSMDGFDVEYAADALAPTHAIKPSDSSQGALVLAPLDDTGVQRILGGGTIVAADKTDEGVSLMDPEGVTLSLGLWRLVVEIDTYQGDATAGILGSVILRRSTNGGSTWSSFATYDLKSFAGFQRFAYTRTSSPRAVVSWEVADETDLWTAYVVFTHGRDPNTGPPSTFMAYRDRILSQVQSVVAPNSMVFDGFAEEAFVMDGNGARLRPLEATGFPSAMPGLNGYLVVMETLPVAGMDIGSLDGPAGIVESDWRANYVIDVWPMDRD